MKKSLTILALATACAAVLGASGCAAASVRLTVDSYWYIDSHEGIQPTSIDPEDQTPRRTPESLLYELTFDEESGANKSYRVDYYTDSENFAEGEDAHYLRTVFYATTFDWSTDTNEEYRLTAEQAGQLDTDAPHLEGTVETVYVLETEFKVSGMYVFGGKDTAANAENSVEFTDYMNTVTYFRSSRNFLEPVYSYKKVHTTTPLTLNPASAETMCTQIEYEYEVFYNLDCTELTYNYKEFGENDSEANPLNGKVSGLHNSDAFFDNNQLYTAVRGMSLSEGFSANISLFVPENMGVMKVRITGGAQGELNPETDKGIIDALEAKYGTPAIPEKDEESTEETEGEEVQHSYIYYNPVSIASSDGRGVVRNVWYAAIPDEDNNTYRATMLYLSQPLSYGLGTWEFTLAEVESVLGNLA